MLEYQKVRQVWTLQYGDVQNGSDPDKVKSEMEIQSGNQSADSNNDDYVVLSDWRFF